MVTLKEKYPLEKKKPLKKTLARFLGFTPLAIIFILPIILLILVIPSEKLPSILSTTLIFLMILILFFVVPLAIYIYEVFYMKYYFYNIVGETLVIKKGVFLQNEISLPFNRLQDVYIDQDVWDRIFGLYDIHVSSATFVSGWLAHIDGINKKNSEIIKNLILDKINKNG